MTARYARFLCLAMMAPSLFGQIHSSLQAHANPFPQIRRYGDLWAQGNYAYVGSDAGNGVLIFDITSPANPVLVANYAPANSNDMEDVKVAGNVGYFASNNGGGLHIVDLTDPTHPALITRITSAQGGADSVHNVWVDNGIVYEPDYTHTPRVFAFDVSDPTNPVLLRTIMTTDGAYIHDMMVKNGRLYTSGVSGQTDIYDVSNIRTQQPPRLGSFASGFASHSCWPNDAATVLACTRELFAGGDLTLYDISNPANVQPLTTLTAQSLGISAVAPSNPVIIGTTMYVSWDQAGLLVFDISNPLHPYITANYDEYPGAIQPGSFDGAWGVYPLLGADRVLLSDRDTGLWIIDTTAASSQPALLSLSVLPTTIPSTTTASGQVFIAGLAPAGGTDITIATTGPLTASSVHLPAGTTNANFAVVAGVVATPTPASLSASYGGTTITANLTVARAQPVSIAFSPTTLLPSQTATATVGFSSAMPVDTVMTISVTSNASLIGSIPANIIVPAGASSATFAVTAAAVLPAPSTVAISVSANGGSASGSLSVTPNIPNSITYGSSYMIGGTNDTMTITLLAPAAADTTVTLTPVSGLAALAVLQPTAVITAGASSITVPIQTAPVTSTVKLKISATVGGFGPTTSVDVVANTPNSIVFSPYTVFAPGSVTITVGLTKATAIDATVSLFSTAGAAAVPALPSTFVVPAGNKTANLTIPTAIVQSATQVTVGFSYSGGSKSNFFTVKPNIPALTVTPAAVVGGANVTGKVVLTVATTTDSTVSLSVLSGNTAITTIPASVFIPAGSTTATFNIATSSAIASSTPAQISAALNGVTSTATLTVNTNSPTSIVFTPSTLIAGASSTAKISFAQAMAADTVITLTPVSGAAAIASIPATVTALAGSTSVSFPVATAGGITAVTPVQVSAAANGGSSSGTLTVNPNSPTTLTLTSAVVVGGASLNGTVTFGRAVSADTVVVLAVPTGTAAIASIPPSVTVTAGTTSASFPIVTAVTTAITAVQITAAANGGTAAASLTVNPNSPTSLTFSPAALIAGANTTGTVVFGRALTADTTVTLTVVSGAAGVNTIPASIVVTAGSTSGTFPVSTASSVANPTTVQISAAANNGSQTGSFTVSPNGPTALSFTPNAVIGGASVTGQVSFGGILSADTPVTLAVTAGAAGVNSIPASVTVLAGQSSASWSIVTNATVSAATPVQVTATANGRSQTAGFTLNPITPASLSISPASVIGGVSPTATVTLTRPVAIDTPVNLTLVSGNAAVQSMPLTVTVLAGSSTAAFNIATNAALGSATTVQISASLNGVTAPASVLVSPNVLASLTLMPATVVAGSPVTGQVAMAGVVAADTVVTLAVPAGSSAITSIPASVVVLAGTSSASFPVGTSATVSASTLVQITATANGTAKSSTVTVNANVPSSMTFSPAYVYGGYPATATVSFGRAVAVDTTVALGVVSGGTALGSMPASVTALAGTASASFPVQTASVSAATVKLKINASANGGGFTGSLDVLPIVPSYFAFASSPILADASTTATVSIPTKAVAAFPVTITVNSGAGAIASIPTTVTIPAGSTFVSFPVVSAPVSVSTIVQVTVAGNGGSKTASFTVNPNVPASLTFTPASVTGSATVTGKVTLSRAVASDTVVTLSVASGGAAVLSAPATVVVLAGTSSATFAVTTQPAGATTVVQMSAGVNGGTASGSFTVN